jgi:hypothetical protein
MSQCDIEFERDNLLPESVAKRNNENNLFIMDSTSSMKKIFAFLIFMLGFGVLVLYINDSKSFINTPYLAHRESHFTIGEDRSQPESIVADHNYHP